MKIKTPLTEGRLRINIVSAIPTIILRERIGVNLGEQWKRQIQSSFKPHDDAVVLKKKKSGGETSGSLGQRTYKLF